MISMNLFSIITWCTPHFFCCWVVLCRPLPKHFTENLWGLLTERHLQGAWCSSRTWYWDLDRLGVQKPDSDWSNHCVLWGFCVCHEMCCRRGTCLQRIAQQLFWGQSQYEIIDVLSSLLFWWVVCFFFPPCSLLLFLMCILHLYCHLEQQYVLCLGDS